MKHAPSVISRWGRQSPTPTSVPEPEPPPPLPPRQFMRQSSLTKFGNLAKSLNTAMNGAKRQSSK